MRAVEIGINMMMSNATVTLHTGKESQRLDHSKLRQQKGRG